MNYQILPTNLEPVADRVKKYLTSHWGLMRVRVEEPIHPDVNWRPTISGDTRDFHQVCVEVTDGDYTASLERAVVQVMTKGLPVRLYIAYPGDSVDATKFLATFRSAREIGIGIVEVRSSGTCEIQQQAIDLSLAAVNRTDLKSLRKKHRQDFIDAESTFLNGDPAKGCSRVYDELESLTRKFAVKAETLGWWNPGNMDLEKGSWASLLTKMNRDFSANLTPVKTKCPDFELTLLSSIHGLTGHRNDSGHKPRSRKALIKRDKQLRTRFEHARDLFVDLQDWTRPLRL